MKLTLEYLMDFYNSYRPLDEAQFKRLALKNTLLKFALYFLYFLFVIGVMCLELILAKKSLLTLYAMSFIYFVIGYLCVNALCRFAIKYYIKRLPYKTFANIKLLRDKELNKEQYLQIFSLCELYPQLNDCIDELIASNAKLTLNDYDILAIRELSNIHEGNKTP